MPKRKLKVFNPINRHKTETGLRISRPSLAQFEEVRSWLLAQMWSRPSLRPPQWDGKLTQDEALRLILAQFADAFGVPLNSDEREEPCSTGD